MNRLSPDTIIKSHLRNEKMNKLNRILVYRERLGLRLFRTEARHYK